MFCNQRSCCSRCCGCCCGSNSNQISGTVIGYIPVTVSYTMTLSGDASNGYGFIPSGSAFDNDTANNSGCGCGCSGRLY